MTQLLTILALVLTVTTAFAQTSKSVTYSDSTRKMGPQDLLIKAQGVTTTVGITNEPATANTIAAFGAGKQLKSISLNGATFDGDTLTITGGGGGSGTNSNWQALGTTNSILAGDAIAYNYKGVLAPELSGTTWNIDVGTYAYRGAISGDTTMTFSGETSSNAWTTEVLILGNGVNTLTLSGANFTVLGGTPDIVPAGVQRLRVTPFGGTNYVSCAWRPISSIDGFMKQSTGGPTIDTTDYATIVNSLQEQINDIIAGGAGGADTIRIGGHTGATWTDGATLYLGGDIAGAAATLTYTNQAVRVLRSGTITSAFIIVRAATAGSAETFSAYLDINAGTTLVTISTTLDLGTTVSKAYTTGLSQAVTAGDYIAIRIVCPTWATDPSTCRAVVYFRVDS